MVHVEVHNSQNVNQKIKFYKIYDNYDIIYNIIIYMGA